jgi:nucleotide-binding universal stress UspA family protein
MRWSRPNGGEAGVDASVVVGVDGSESSLAAVELAAREAVLRDLPLRLVHAFIRPT